MPAAPDSRPAVLSGIAASGSLHLGNYLGAIRQWAAQQDQFRNYFFVADFHALTVPGEVKDLQLGASSRRMVALYVAAGLDPERSVLFRQSDVRAHTELHWLLSCVTPTGWLNRMTQYKTKAANREAERVSTGLYTYPVLQAADILLYQPEFVPVGEDQRQHVELARDVAQRFNHLFGPVFTEPEARSPEVGARVMGLDDPEQKMSKTVAATKRGHAVGLLDDPDEIRRSIMRAQTDPGSDISFAGAQPGVRNLLTIFEALTGRERDSIEKEFDGRGYGDLKKAVAEVVVESLTPIRARYDELLADAEALEAILRNGAQQAGEVAERTLRAAREALGLEPDHLI